MRVVMFYHSLVSDWNHGNAHFLRGIVRELLDRGHDVRVFEPRDGWSRANLVRDHGSPGLDAFTRAYPGLRSELYDLASIDLNRALAGADLVLVHEWNEHGLVARIGVHRVRHEGYRLLFHDTHHRSMTDTACMAAYDLRFYDGVLAFGDAIRDRYLERGWTTRAWTWHEAADTRVFYPRTTPAARGGGDVVWIGNWGDEERSADIEEFFLEPVRTLGLCAAAYGVRYPAGACARLAESGVTYGGWLPNADVPDVYARYKVTVHIPRRPYVDSLPGVPTIRPFEALACGIPLVTARWDRTADLFTAGDDFLVAHTGREMTTHLAALLADAARRRALAARGSATIAARHTCAHRVDELMEIVDGIAMEAARS
jgi:spore maturation protein CgeB